jgi:hypothetical protein
VLAGKEGDVYGQGGCHPVNIYNARLLCRLAVPSRIMPNSHEESPGAGQMRESRISRRTAADVR